MNAHRHLALPLLCFDLASPLLHTNSVPIPYKFSINSVKMALFPELVRNKHGINLELYACKGEDEAKMKGGKWLYGEWRVESGEWSWLRNWEAQRLEEAFLNLLIYRSPLCRGPTNKSRV